MINHHIWRVRYFQTTPIWGCRLISRSTSKSKFFFQNTKHMCGIPLREYWWVYKCDVFLLNHEALPWPYSLLQKGYCNYVMQRFVGANTFAVGKPIMTWPTSHLHKKFMFEPGNAGQQCFFQYILSLMYPPVIKMGKGTPEHPPLDHFNAILPLRPPFTGEFSASHVWLPQGTTQLDSATSNP